MAQIHTTSFHEINSTPFFKGTVTVYLLLISVQVLRQNSLDSEPKFSTNYYKQLIYLYYINYDTQSQNVV